MKKVLILSMFLLGCQATGENSNTTSTDTPQAVPEKYQNKVNTKYAVMLQDVYSGIRTSLYDGMVVTILGVKLSKYGSPLVLIKDENGKQIFDEWYGFSDLGLWDQDIRPVKVNVDETIVNQKLGKVIHGYGYRIYDNQFGKDYGYESYVTRNKIDGSVAYGYSKGGKYGLGVDCLSNKKVVLTYQDSEIWAASGANVKYSFYIDQGAVFKGDATMYSNSYKKSYFYLPVELEKQILAGGVRAGYKLSSRSETVSGRAYLDGFAEMYLRIKKNCS
jgi:hypothetical protein